MLVLWSLNTKAGLSSSRVAGRYGVVSLCENSGGYWSNSKVGKTAGRRVGSKGIVGWTCFGFGGRDSIDSSR